MQWKLLVHYTLMKTLINKLMSETCMVKKENCETLYCRCWLHLFPSRLIVGLIDRPHAHANFTSAAKNSIDRMQCIFER